MRLIMMSKKNIELQKLSSLEGKLYGGFAPISVESLNKIKGGKKGLSDTNDQCINSLYCTGDNTGCNNKQQCS